MTFMASRFLLRTSFFPKKQSRHVIRHRVSDLFHPRHQQGVAPSSNFLQVVCDPRAYSSSSSTKSSSSSSNPNDWRKKQLEQLERKFKDPQVIDSDEELQPMWKEMESRVTRRKPRTLRETGGRKGRMNIRKTDEDVWAQEGLYSSDEDNTSSKGA
mmetsp:Transcript_15177/g.27377  ORF Transcript_15177/g.27377 Transcript_15177/m.27377 type:complete len:156 (+) Transcript_15177:148-615(+)